MSEPNPVAPPAPAPATTSTFNPMTLFPFAIMGFMLAMNAISKSNKAVERVDALQKEVDALKGLVEQLMAKA
ncbi:hypothetical protein EHS25_002748 [Saitozyma podzolica]|uniref:Uncharacterized protein n=1 Tax=Saitozyma podzolica TaxID=1890683 RepID=A0A427YDD3_9TREE|nr:hypothetical protein EHS25_002748 [Saitozyma podzolica]